MTLRIVVYAEGGRELGAATGFGENLEDREMGPAHDLVRRCASESGRVPDAAIVFVRPLRRSDGKVARGSDLLHRSARRLLAWPPGGHPPHVAVFLVDTDGDASRRGAAEAAVAGALIAPVIGVAVQEFEAWLIADDAAVTRALGIPFPTPPAPEAMRPREAKEMLGDAIGRSGLEPLATRRSIARTCALEVIAGRCSAFRRFRGDLIASVP